MILCPLCLLGDGTQSEGLLEKLSASHVISKEQSSHSTFLNFNFNQSIVSICDRKSMKSLCQLKKDKADL